MKRTGRRRTLLLFAVLALSAGARTDAGPMRFPPREAAARPAAAVAPLVSSSLVKVPAPRSLELPASRVARTARPVLSRPEATSSAGESSPTGRSVLRTVLGEARRVARVAASLLQPTTATAQEPRREAARDQAPASGATFRSIAQLPGLQPVLIELMLGRIARRTVEAYRTGDAALVPLSAFFDLAEIRAIRRPGGVLEAMAQPGNVPLVLDPASHTLRLGKERLSLGPEELVATEDEVFLSTAVLARVFALEWDVSWPDLQVAVIEPGTLPVARRIRRESMLRAQLMSSGGPEQAGPRLGLQRSQLKGLVLDYSFLTPTNGLDAGAYATTMGLDLFGGALAVGVQSQNGTGRPPRTEASWTGIWRENRWLSQATVGDGISTGPRSRTLRGASISNSPYARPSILGHVPFDGQLGTGWTVEAYRGGRLIGFDSVNSLGRYSFDVPIQYGENPVDFVAYGPFGEVREFNQTYRLATEGLPARRVEYGLSAGACRTDRCSNTANVDLRYGLTTRWTARAGVDRFSRDSLGDLTHPYVGLLGSVTNSIAVEAEAVGNAVLRGAVRFEPSVNLAVGAEAHRFSQNPRDPLLTPEGRLDQFTLTAFLRPLGQQGGLFFEGSLDRIHTATTVQTSARAGASFQVSEVRVLPAIRVQQTTGAGPLFRQTFLSLNTYVLPQPSLGRLLGRLTARTSLDIEGGAGVSGASAYVSAPLRRGFRAETGVTWMRGTQGPGLSLMIAAELPTVRSYTTVTAGGGREAMGTQYVTGSAIYNPARGGADFYGGSSLSRGGVAGRVFLDTNGNGKFDRDEHPLEGVRVVVGPTFDFSDENGAYQVWDVLPYEPAQVTVDSASIPSPLWVPAFGMVLVEPAPNRYRRLDVPVVPAGIIEGRLAGPAAGRVGAAAVTLILHNKKTGEKRRIDTFSDGTFYAMGVRAGEWQLSVDPSCLTLLNATAAPLSFVMRGSAEGETVSGLELVLQ